MQTQIIEKQGKFTFEKLSGVNWTQRVGNPCTRANHVENRNTLLHFKSLKLETKMRWVHSEFGQQLQSLLLYILGNWEVEAPLRPHSLSSAYVFSSSPSGKGGKVRWQDLEGDNTFGYIWLIFFQI